MRRKSVADALSLAQRGRAAALPAGERIRLALELGQRSLADYCAATGLDRDGARRRLERRRQARRRRSGCIRALLA